MRIADILITSRARFMPYAPSAHSEIDVGAWVRERLVPEGGVTVADEAGNVVGLVAVSHHGNCLWINQLCVDPARVAGGIGSLLLAHALRTRLPSVRLYTFQANAGARRFYERHGFVAIEWSDGLTNEEKCPDVIYQKEMANLVASTETERSAKPRAAFG